MPTGSIVSSYCSNEFDQKEGRYIQVAMMIQNTQNQNYKPKHKV